MEFSSLWDSNQWLMLPDHNGIETENVSATIKNLITYLHFLSLPNLKFDIYFYYFSPHFVVTIPEAIVILVWQWDMAEEEDWPEKYYSNS